MKIAMLSTGEEVLHGDIVDSNAAWLGERCFESGLPMAFRMTVGDSVEALKTAIDYLARSSDVVIVNGGLGPTEDDLSALAMAELMEQPLALSSYWLAQMEEKYRELGRVMPDTNRKQAMLPEGAEVIDNPVGTACGFVVRYSGADIYFTPGVPSEFYTMVNNAILPRLTVGNSSAMHCHRIYTFGLSESGISQRLSDFELPEGLVIGYRSYLPFIEVKLFFTHKTPRLIALIDTIQQALSANTVGVNGTLAKTIGDVLVSRQLKVAVAEQFTGGRVLSALTQAIESSQCTGANQQCQGWVLPNESEQDLDGEPDNAWSASVLSSANAILDMTAADIGLAVGNQDAHGISLALKAGGTEVTMRVTSRRKRKRAQTQLVVTTLLLDILRRYLDGAPLIGDYESFKVEVGVIEE